jgi:hypothetical protein
MIYFEFWIIKIQINHSLIKLFSGQSKNITILLYFRRSINTNEPSIKPYFHSNNLSTVKHNIILLIFAILSFTCIRTQAQQALPASGGNASGTEGTVSYSVGQVFYSMKTGTSGTVSEGIEQPYEILSPIGIEHKEMMTECMLFPNPVSRNMTLTIDRTDLDGFNYTLFSMTGKLLLESEITGKETLIPMEDLEKGVYFMRITGIDNSLKTFYIIKK